MSIIRKLPDGRAVTARANDGLRKRCGCPRSVWTKRDRCKHPWHANYSYAGVEHRVSLHKWAKKPAGYEMLKGEAEQLFRQWQTVIEAGRAAAAPAAPGLTLAAAAERYGREYVQHPDRRPEARKEMARQVRVLVAAFGPKPLTAITKAMIEDFRTARRLAHDAASAEGKASGSTKAGRVSTNRLLARLRHVFVWAIEHDLVDGSPFTRSGVSVIKLDRKAESSRSRRLEDGEYQRLVQHAGSHLRACIEATLETGMRRGEILGVQWQHVRLSQGLIELPATITKTGIGRVVVISSRLASILAMRRTAPDGREHEPTTYVFGDECGGRVKGFKTAWKLTCKRAGIAGLRFHDLRREAGSRLIEAPGVSLTDVRDFLGHRDVSQTNTYLATTVLRQRAAIEKRDLARTPLAQTTTAPIAAPLTH